MTKDAMTPEFPPDVSKQLAGQLLEEDQVSDARTQDGRKLDIR
jgi:hypothetical protein